MIGNAPREVVRENRADVDAWRQSRSAETKAGRVIQ
jgi:hypothetical protein